jgi:hypothetical protein
VSKSILVPYNFNQLEIQNAVVQLLGSDPGSPVNGQIWINTASWTLKLRLNGVTVLLGRLDQISAPTANVSLGSQRIVSLADGQAATDAATVGQVTASRNAMTWKDPVRAATTANGTFASAFQNGAAIDGITLATGDRILLKDQTTGSQNGIYVVNATGAPTRAIDADVSAELPSASVVPVDQGTANADSMWILTTNAPITLGTTALTFAKIPIGGGNTYVAGVGLLESPAGTFIVNPAVVPKDYRTTIGDNSATQITVTHNLNTRAVDVEVYLNSGDYDTVECEVRRTGVNTVRLDFGVAPTTNQYAVLVMARSD